VLDAACGSGNLTIPAARAGASVSGLDLVPALLADAARWARRERLDVALEEGNVKALPYADAEFDVALSMFGLMFAARPDRVAAELARVTRPGGRVALANWTRAGFTGQMLAMHAAAVPLPDNTPGQRRVPGEEHARHATAAKLALERVGGAERRLQAVTEEIGHHCRGGRRSPQRGCGEDTAAPACRSHRASTQPLRRLSRRRRPRRCDESRHP
jgi:2-polyprenyl-3-methyl-5-hydroxy-6-metoxy-1,4-benzoquinol methylase